GQVAAPVFGAIARQVLLYRGVHPERDRPVFWPGQVPSQVIMAGLPAVPSANGVLGAIDHEDDVPTDGDDRTLTTVPDPVLWRGPSSPAAPASGPAPPGANGEAGQAGPAGDHPGTEGGRSHASR